MRLVELRKRRGGVAGQHHFKQPPHAPAIGQPEHLAHRSGLDLALTMRDRLVEDRQAVARGTFGGAGDHRERLILHQNAFLMRDRGEVRDKRFGRDPTQVEALTARQHGDRHLGHFGGREQEFHMLRRLLKSLQ